MNTTQTLKVSIPITVTIDVEAWNIEYGAAYITTQTDGTYRVACFIEYGDGDRSWCDGATYKTVAGATRKAKAFCG
jgi:hypothetical protein